MATWKERVVATYHFVIRKSEIVNSLITINNKPLTNHDFKKKIYTKYHAARSRFEHAIGSHCG